MPRKREEGRWHRPADARAALDSQAHIKKQMRILTKAPSSKKKPHVMRLPEFLERAQIGRTKAYELRAAGKIKTYKISARIEHWDLDSYFDAMMNQPHRSTKRTCVQRISRIKRDPRLGVPSAEYHAPKKTKPDSTP